MKRRVFVSLLALVVSFVVGGGMAHAQNISTEIGFPFLAGTNEMPAGKYNVEVTAAGVVVFTGAGGLRAVLPVITTLGRNDKDVNARFVFDKTDGKSVISEVWLPRKDGMLVAATKGPHAHAILDPLNPKK